MPAARKSRISEDLGDPTVGRTSHGDRNTTNHPRAFRTTFDGVRQLDRGSLKANNVILETWTGFRVCFRNNVDWSGLHVSTLLHARRRTKLSAGRFAIELLRSLRHIQHRWRGCLGFALLQIPNSLGRTTTTHAAFLLASLVCPERLKPKYPEDGRYEADTCRTGARTGLREPNRVF